MGPRATRGLRGGAPPGRQRHRTGPPGVPRWGGDVRVRAARGHLCQGRHQPAPLPVAARTAARQASHNRARRAGVARRRAPQANPPGARDPAQAGHRAGHRGRWGGRARRRARRVGPAAMTVLCLVELDADGPADASLRALTFATRLASAAPAGPAPIAAVLFGPADQVPGDALAAYGAASAYVVEPGQLDDYAPRAWAQALAGLAGETDASAVVAAATDRGNEVMAYLGALTGLPMAANCVQAEPGEDGTHQVVRHRWAGLLLEEASLTGSPGLMTVATEAVPAAVVAEPVGTLQVRPYVPSLSEDDLRVRATETAGHSSGASLATARVVVGGGRGVGGPDGFAPLEELAGLRGGVGGGSPAVTWAGWGPRRPPV